ncbi:hypothetical protein [Segniliparus rugosus]|uniref:Uncharacterized protein n=1 Tax=Segniliparus rugosus (strain ATCC BAA-974 / DSM 45345 / CCUG 50838 / CIP 108380 / JCM 13579 / CDC 945) TaxID=679197 RepID=E5XU01_SEGRC|nr:hypothetical protein [Segniliparus rugosus]EFV12170.2 hypothetical protein HMPREF9336_02973 [Segniliparus rugosus ATCC BAA-974]
MTMRAALVIALGAAASAVAPATARADDQHDCELFQKNSGEILTNAQTAVDHMQQASQDQGRDAAQDAASAIVYFRQAGDAAKLLAVSLQTPSGQSAATKLDEALYAQADAFDGTIKGQGSQASLDKFKETTARLKAAITGFKQAVEGACGT